MNNNENISLLWIWTESLASDWSIKSFLHFAFCAAAIQKGEFNQSDESSQFFVSLLETNSSMVG